MFQNENLKRPLSQTAVPYFPCILQEKTLSYFYPVIAPLDLIVNDTQNKSCKTKCFMIKELSVF